MTGEWNGTASLVCKVRESGGEVMKWLCTIYQKALCSRADQLGENYFCHPIKSI